MTMRRAAVVTRQEFHGDRGTWGGGRATPGQETGLSGILQIGRSVFILECGLPGTLDERSDPPSPEREEELSC